MVRTLVGSDEDNWLEPCAGDGALLRALADQSVPSSRIRAVDVRSKRLACDRLARSITGTEFLAWANECGETFRRIVANPPYVALHRLPKAVRKAAKRHTSLQGEPISGRANEWYAFLCASLSLLETGGSVCFVLPAAYEYAGYARHLRSELPYHFRTVEVHRSKAPLFTGVREGSVVIVLRGFGEGPGELCRFEHASPAELAWALSRGHGAASREHSFASPGVTSDFRASGDSVRFGDIATVRLGGVTGDVRYFLLSEKERQRRNLPVRALVPVVSRARHLSDAVMTPPIWETLKRRGERIWLFRPTKIATQRLSVRRYLRLKERSGGCRRGAFKVRSRQPWYRTPLPSHVDGFMSGMASCGPFVCLSDVPGLSATNTLYVVRFRAPLGASKKAAWCLALLSSQATRAIRSVGRLYADGLVKYEPSDIIETRVPTPTRWRGAAAAYRSAVRALLRGDSQTCRAIADSFVQSRDFGWAG